MTKINVKDSITQKALDFKKQNLKRDKNDKRYYQLEAYDSLTNKLLNDDSRTAGLLVLPTGGGKTRVSVTWAIDKAINDGYKILWLAHRKMLIQQAHDTFLDFAGLVDMTKKKSLNIRIVSSDSNHSKVEDINFQEDDIVISTIQAISHKNKAKFLRRSIYDGRRGDKNINKLLVIVDEAHHSTAPTYEKLIGQLTNNKKTTGYFRELKKANKLKSLKILGLTATPINANSNTEKKLISFYDKEKPLFEIATSTLIKSGVLSRPKLFEIPTNIEITAVGQTTTQKEISANKQLSEDPKRNDLIIKTYMNSFLKKNDKTLLFAVNINHAELLKAMFNKIGINCEVIHSKNEQALNEQLVRKFQEDDSNLDLLINVEILTEGSDIPKIKNLFITRIVGSETLFTQMVGRALRGEDADGTKDANIITFNDNITNFDILSLKGVFDDAGYDGEYTESNINLKWWNDKKYSINEIQEELKKVHPKLDENGEVVKEVRNVLINYPTIRDLNFKEEYEGKESGYILGKKLAPKIFENQENKYRWSFEAKEQYSFLEDEGRTNFENIDENQENFYFITKEIDIPRSSNISIGDILGEWGKNPNNYGCEILPSYGIPIGEYILRFNDESKEYIQIFKFQKNSYDDFFQNIDSIDIKDTNLDEKEKNEYIKKWNVSIKERYFKEANNFIPVSDRVLSILYLYVKDGGDEPEFVENDFDLIDRVEDLIDEIVRKDVQEIETFNPRKSYQNKEIKQAYYSLQNFRDEVNNRIDIHYGDAQEAGKIVYFDDDVLELSQYNYVNPEEFNKIHNIDELYESASKIVCKVLEIPHTQYAPKKATWTKRAYKSYFGMARGINMYTKAIEDKDKDKSRIEINSILCSKDIPKYAIEFVLYHEILHFELRVLHDGEFKEYECKYENFDGSYNFLDAERELQKVSNWINNHWTKKDKNIINQIVNKEVVPITKYKLYDNKKYSLNDIRKLVKKYNLTLLSLEDIKNLDKDFKQELLMKQIFWVLLSDDLKNPYNLKDDKYFDVKHSYVLVKENSYE